MLASPGDKTLAREKAIQCKEPQGKVETIPIDTQNEGISEFTLYLPPCYKPNPIVRYPVLYLLHGMNNNDQQWVKIGAPAAADRLILSGKALPFLIVMPREDSTDQNADDTPFDAALVDKLVPWIDQHYATCINRSCRAIGGLSRGSGWSIRIGLMYWQMFGAIGSHSVSPFDGDTDHLKGWIQSLPAENYPRVYLDIGTYDQALPDATAVEQIFAQSGVAHEWHLFEGGHNMDYWMAHVKDYLLWYSQGW